MPLDEQILAELAADEKVTEEEVADEIERPWPIEGRRNYTNVNCHRRTTDRATDKTNQVTKLSGFLTNLETYVALLYDR